MTLGVVQRLLVVPHGRVRVAEAPARPACTNQTLGQQPPAERGAVRPSGDRPVIRHTIFINSQTESSRSIVALIASFGIPRPASAVERSEFAV